MKIAIIGDIHFGSHNDSIFFLNKTNDTLRLFLKHLRENDIHTIVQLGDFFDKRKYINFRTLHYSKWFLHELEHFNTITLIGNHDCFYNNTLQINSLSLLLQNYNITVIDKFKTITIDNKPFDFIPWINSENREAIFKQIENTKSDTLFAHLEIGMLTPEEKKSIERYRVVYSGHHHNAYKTSVVNYIGNCLQLTWAEHGVDKAFYILNTETNEAKRIDFFNPVYKIIDFDHQQNPFDFKHESYKDKIVKVLYSDQSDKKHLEDFLSQLSKYAYDITLIDSSIITTKATQDNILYEKPNDDFLFEYTNQMVDDESDRAFVLDYVNRLHKMALETA
jgi:hypothetical protein